ncbi:hypothetical protein Pmani_023122 [Petrolisthes manimaculis]|uniref:HIT-type domain-containing protein n=1 Tax=Petrolisthes manimaculis TaxID=1843537 RepID=A0AAE1PCX0_9EUCA|nr:hypothetical protein Pmani_023122 [Petrolisthes manimaculis]
MASVSEEGKCNFCTNESKYTCPRCNVAYCTAACYKHSSHAQCSEEFYRTMVEEELHGGAVSDESRKKMIEILRRANSGESPLEDGEDALDSDDDEDMEDLDKRMADIDLNNSEAVWKKLSEEERKEFQELIKNGEIEDLIPPWIPWWEQEVPKVQEVSSPSSSTPAYVLNCPNVVDAPMIKEVMKGSPSPCIPFNILNVLAAYSWTVRLFNGDHQDSSLDATEAIFVLSSVLSSNANFEEAAVAVESPKIEAQNHLWLMESEEFCNTVRNDVWKILKGPTSTDKTFYMRAAISEIHVLLSTCKVSLTKRKKSPGTRKGIFPPTLLQDSNQVELKLTTLPTVKLAMKKVEFFLSYINEYSSVLASISP